MESNAPWLTNVETVIITNETSGIGVNSWKGIKTIKTERHRKKTKISFEIVTRSYSGITWNFTNAVDGESNSADSIIRTGNIYMKNAIGHIYNLYESKNSKKENNENS